MLNKFVIGALAAGAVSVPLAGIAAAQTGNDTGTGTAGGGTTVSTHAHAGIGAGGLPVRIGTHFGGGTTTTMTPPQLLAPLVAQAQAAGQSLPQYLRTLTPPIQSPGAIISGIAHNVFPPTSLNLGMSGGGSVSGGTNAG